MKKYFTASEVAERWECHRASVLRTCRRFGYSGAKFGGRASARRFDRKEIERIEAAAGGQLPGVEAIPLCKSPLLPSPRITNRTD